MLIVVQHYPPDHSVIVAIWSGGRCRKTDVCKVKNILVLNLLKTLSIQNLLRVLLRNIQLSRYSGCGVIISTATAGTTVDSLVRLW